jgi:hypothetical protein
VERQKVIEAALRVLGPEHKSKSQEQQKRQPHSWDGWKLRLKAKPLGFQIRSMMGARKTLSRVRDERRYAAPLTTFAAPMPICFDKEISRTKAA